MKKTELELEREKLESANIDLLAYRKHAGESPVIDANIRHKEAYVRQQEIRVRTLEEAERAIRGEQTSLIDMFNKDMNGKMKGAV